jgi:hypothetical protein
MQGYKVKEKTAIVYPVSKLSGHPVYGLSVHTWVYKDDRVVDGSMLQI